MKKDQKVQKFKKFKGRSWIFFFKPKKVRKVQKKFVDFLVHFVPKILARKTAPLQTCFFFGGCSLVRPILPYGTLFFGWSYYLEASFHQTCPCQFFLTTHSHSCSLQVVWRNAIPGFCPCSKPKKNLHQFYCSHPWLVSLPSHSLLPAISG